MGASRPVPGATGAVAVPAAPYDVRRLSYATTFDDPLRANAIRTIEWCTGKMRLLRLVRRFEAEGVEHGQGFFDHALAVMGIRLDTPPREIARIPADGPVVVVANHPHGLVDGMVLAALVGARRRDYRILTRSLLTGIPEIERFVIPVPFQDARDALPRNLEARRMARAQLDAGGVVALFPSGGVAASQTAWGDAVEGPWSAFTAKLIRGSGATVVPVRFPGQNSRLYQIAARISPTLRQGLLLHEVVRASGRPVRPVIGAPIPCADWAARGDDPRAFIERLRRVVLALG